MKVMTISAYGGPDVFTQTEMADPSVGDIRAGLVPPATPDFPACLHADVAGVVSAVGNGVDHLKVGDEVWGCAGGFKGLPSGGLAERMLTDAALVTQKPKNISFAEAAALPLVSLTAWFALADRAEVSAGDSVLVHAGAGGVGHVAVQIAKHLGGVVHTTVSSDAKGQIANTLGADAVIDYTQQSVEDYVSAHTEGRGYDVVFDTVGGANLDASFQAARFGGTVVNIAARSTHDLSPMHARSLTLHVVFLVGQVANPVNRHSIRPRLEKLRALVERDELTPVLDANQFAIHDVANAHAYLESGQAVGKVVLTRE
jgi:NADPH2:quinone reductase